MKSLYFFLRTIKEIIPIMKIIDSTSMNGRSGVTDSVWVSFLTVVGLFEEDEVKSMVV